MKKKTTTKIVAISIVIAILFTITYFSLQTSSAFTSQLGLPVYTDKTLSQFNGSDLNSPVLIAYEGYVYDVSAGRNDFYNEGKDYHYLAGRDSTADLNIVGGSIIKRKYKIVGVYK